MGPRSSPSYLSYSPANGHATALPAAAHCQPPQPQLKQLTLIAATVSYQPSNQSWGSAAIWPQTQRQKKMRKQREFSVFNPFLICHPEADQTRLGNNSVLFQWHRKSYQTYLTSFVCNSRQVRFHSFLKLPEPLL